MRILHFFPRSCQGVAANFLTWVGQAAEAHDITIHVMYADGVVTYFVNIHALIMRFPPLARVVLMCPAWIAASGGPAAQPRKGTKDDRRDKGGN